jgi:hypothetical protein
VTNRRWPAGIVDTHVHTAPDVVPRLLDDGQVVRQADEAEYRAVVLKSHHTVTAARATMAEQQAEETRAFGGVVLNLHATGGINRYAVDAALKLGAKVVWLPTITSANQVRYGREVGIKSGNLRALGTIEGDGLSVLDDQGAPTEELCHVFDLMAEAGATLATGHVSPAESLVVVPEARRRGVPNVIITHPELRCIGMTVEQQLELAQLDNVWFERVLAVTLPTSDDVPMTEIAESVRTVGVGSTIMATDFGQAHNAPPVEGLKVYIDRMRGLGFTQDDLEAMTSANPSAALSLDA